MSTISKIEWTDRTWNPVRGCSEVSEGCRNCYAMRQAHRFDHPGGAYEGLTRMTERGPVWTGTIRLVESELEAPLRWTRPSRVFVNSMSDLFHEDVPDTFIDKVFAIMALAKEHTFQILTKRPERMRDYLLGIQDDDKDMQRWANEAPEKYPCASGVIEDRDWPLSNVWLGVSVENRGTTGRIYHLFNTPAAVRFLSLEPLLEDLGIVSLTDYPKRVDWVIVGGESGPRARSCYVGWIGSIVRQCQAARVPVFVKQLGARPLSYYRGWSDGKLLKLKDHKGGEISEWPEDLRVREFPR